MPASFCLRARALSSANASLSSCLFASVPSSSILTRHTCKRNPAPRTRGFRSARICEEKRYAQSHEWIELSDDKKTGTIGISHFAAKSLGDVVFVELPAAELELVAGDAMGAVESVKSASDLYAPISGTITEGNALLEEKPGILNKGPEGEGWIAKIRVKDAKEVEKLMSVEAYRKHTEEE